MVDASESVIGAKGAEPLLLTPAEAARLLRVRESWLRRQAGQRRVPCSFVGKHLRFSHADIEQIAKAGRRPARTSSVPGSGSRGRSFE
ncbi:helix-turn-helix domain-containing protein [Actinokineospora pegani]|uniref:helix-turn-helix domain-containing protein n=1 Tax=Actinokineospora pegani TaxID=2654637 RepID=UPI0012EAD4A2|nr:helix-turn-helix domain-containing protein [Actinokineospora pegani]